MRRREKKKTREEKEEEKTWKVKSENEKHHLHKTVLLEPLLLCSITLSSLRFAKAFHSDGVTLIFQRTKIIFDHRGDQTAAPKSGK